MSVVFGTASTVLGTTGTSVIVPALTGLAVGDVMILVANVNKSPETWTLPPGFTLIAAGTGTNPEEPTATTSTVFAYKVATAGDLGATFTVSISVASTHFNAAIATWTGADAVTPIDVNATFNGGSSAGPSNAGDTTVTDGCMILALLGDGDSATPTAKPAGYTPRVDFGQVQAWMWFGELLQATQGASGAVSWTMAATHSWTTAVVALRPSGGAPGNPGIFSSIGHPGPRQF